MDYSLSENDIRHYLGEKVRIIKYVNIVKFKTLDELLKPYGVCFILYENDFNYGHWTVVFKNRWGVEFFDSYGRLIDDMIKDLKNQYSPNGLQSYHYLTQLIMNSVRKKRSIISNAYQLQKYDPKITTCGRWCLFRYINRRSDLRAFIDIFKNNPNPDLLITKLVIL